MEWESRKGRRGTPLDLLCVSVTFRWTLCVRLYGALRAQPELTTTANGQANAICWSKFWLSQEPITLGL